jgi:DNA-binding beta-propeller fold protein YncE
MESHFNAWNYCVVMDHSNKSVKVIDIQSKHVTSEIGIEAEYIWSVTSVSDDQVAVSVTLSGARCQIQLFIVSASGVIQRTNQVYNVGNWYHDMVHCEGNIYGVKENRIDVLNMTGKIIRTIQPDDNGEDLFGYLTGIALSPDRQTLYVTDSLKQHMTSMTMDGKVKVIYKDKALKDPRGITVDKHGYVYIRSWNTDNIHQLTADLNKVQVLIEDVYGIGIIYSSSEHKLYASDVNQINQYSLDVN